MKKDNRNKHKKRHKNQYHRPQKTVVDSVCTENPVGNQNIASKNSNSKIGIIAVVVLLIFFVSFVLEKIAVFSPKIIAILFNGGLGLSITMFGYSIIVFIKNNADLCKRKGSLTFPNMCSFIKECITRYSKMQFCMFIFLTALVLSCGCISSNAHLAEFIMTKLADFEPENEPKLPAQSDSPESFPPQKTPPVDTQPPVDISSLQTDDKGEETNETVSDEPEQNSSGIYGDPIVIEPDRIIVPSSELKAKVLFTEYPISELAPALIKATTATDVNEGDFTGSADDQNEIADISNSESYIETTDDLDDVIERRTNFFNSGILKKALSRLIANNYYIYAKAYIKIGGNHNTILYYLLESEKWNYEYLKYESNNYKRINAFKDIYRRNKEILDYNLVSDSEKMYVEEISSVLKLMTEE